MKLILSGSSGVIGNEVLHQCLQNNSVTSVIAISRRALKVSHPKLQVIILNEQEFMTYPDSVTAKLVGAEAAIWCLGGYSLPFEQTIDYATAAATSFATKIAKNMRTERKFRFVCCYSKMAEDSWLSKSTKSQDGIEDQLLDVEDEHFNVFETYFIPSTQSHTENVKMLPKWAIPRANKLKSLASSLVGAAINRRRLDI